MAWGGYRNGAIPTSAMVYVFDGWARPDFAIRLVQAVTEIWVTFGIRITFNELFRDIAGQIYWLDYWSGRGKPGNAATPGYSNHGWAVAGDMNYHEWQPQYWDIVAIFARYGIVFDVPGEDWHLHDLNDWNGFTPVDYQLAFAAAPAPITQEESDMLVYANNDTNVWAAASNGRWEGIPAGQGDAYVLFSGHDRIDLSNADFEAARGYWLGGRISDYGVYADTSTNLWYVLGPGLAYPIPAGEGPLWESLYGPRQPKDADTIQKMIAGYQNMAARTDVEGVLRAIGNLVGPKHV
jgi:hypothetical protein